MLARTGDGYERGESGVGDDASAASTPLGCSIERI
jgi:hypothetical protein